MKDLRGEKFDPIGSDALMLREVGMRYHEYLRHGDD
jgi:hypothetical protein